MSEKYIKHSRSLQQKFTPVISKIHPYKKSAGINHIQMKKLQDESILDLLSIFRQFYAMPHSPITWQHSTITITVTLHA